MKFIILCIFALIFSAHRVISGELIDHMPDGTTYRLTDHNGWRWYTFLPNSVGVVRTKDDIRERFTAENDGLGADNVTGIAEDKYFNIWLTHNPEKIETYGCSRFDGDNWEAYYPGFYVFGGGVDEEGNFWIHCYIPYFETEMYYDCIYDGYEWYAYLTGTSERSVNITRRYEDGLWTVEGIDTDDIDGGYEEHRTVGDYFPLTVGSEWTYRRTVSGKWLTPS